MTIDISEKLCTNFIILFVFLRTEHKTFLHLIINGEKNYEKR